MTAVAAVHVEPRPAHSRLPLLLLGLGIWAIALVVVPAPLAARILLLAPLVIVPRVLTIRPPRALLERFAGWPTFLAALPLLIAFGLPAGPMAGIFALPWLAIASLGAIAGFRHGLSQLPGIVRPGRADELGVDVALGFWFVGAMFIAVDRLGVETGFAPAIVLLTATHFHFAGFGLLALASRIATSRRWLRVSVLGLMIGIPLTAVGFIVVSDGINAIGALVVGLSGIGVAIALLTDGGSGGVVWMRRIAGLALLIGMPMGIAWSLAILSGRGFLDLDTMIRTHGVLNSLAVLLGVVAYRDA